MGSMTAYKRSFYLFQENPLTFHSFQKILRTCFCKHDFPENSIETWKYWHLKEINILCITFSRENFMLILCLCLARRNLQFSVIWDLLAGQILCLAELSMTKILPLDENGYQVNICLSLPRKLWVLIRSACNEYPERMFRRKKKKKNISAFWLKKKQQPYLELCRRSEKTMIKLRIWKLISFTSMVLFLCCNSYEF